MLNLEVTHDTYLDFYYSEIGKKRPAGKQYQADVTAVSRLRRGNCIPQSDNAFIVEKFVDQQGVQQPINYVLRTWKEIVSNNPEYLRKRCHEFIYCEYSKSRRVQDISPWIWLLARKQLIHLNEVEKYFCDKFLQYQSHVDIIDLQMAVRDGLLELHKLTNEVDWITEVDDFTLIDYIFDIWKEILQNMFGELNIGHVKSKKMYQELLPNYLKVQCLVKAEYEYERVVTRNIPLDELQKIQRQHWHETWDKWEKYA